MGLGTQIKESRGGKTVNRVEVLGVEGIPEVGKDESLSALIEEGIRTSGLDLHDGDIVVVSQKVISKAEGQVFQAADLSVRTLARLFAAESQKAPEQVELVLREARRVVRMEPERGILIAETRHGFVCANAGIDRSNVGKGEVYTALPIDPDASAHRLRDKLQRAFAARIGVIVSDSFGRPWRQGSTDVAIGVAGLSPLQDHRGLRDPYGYKLRSTVVAVADEVAAAADLAKGKLGRVPVAIVRGVEFGGEEGSIRDAIRPGEEDLFR
jgi:coenzyme F420-0:L-glutamate ligase/coenzyme F420-1:gamma-L-glutamate ligase